MRTTTILSIFGFTILIGCVVESAPPDLSPAPPPTLGCGDGVCNVGETAGNCPADCAIGRPHCGDGTCSNGETIASCPLDCFPEVCGDGVCFGAETCGACPEDCGECPPVCATATLLDEDLPVDRTDSSTAASAELDRASCGDGATGPTLHYQWAAPVVGRYQVTASGTFAAVLDVRRGDCNAPDLACTTAPAGGVATATITVTTGESMTIAVAGLAGASGDVHLQIVRLPDACGDGLCELSEDCTSCPDDCGGCAS